MARRARLTHVLRKEQLTPGVIRLVVGGEDLADLGVGEFTDHYVKLQIPPPGAAYTAPFDLDALREQGTPREELPRVRTYTVRAHDPAARELTLDVVVHGDEGAAGPWAVQAEPGDPLQILGPGGGYAPRPDADWHLLAGDASVLPAIAAALPQIPAGVPVRVVLAVHGPEEQQPLSSPGALEVRWAGEDELVPALRALDFPAGTPHVFLHGEATDVREARRHLVADRGLDPQGASISGYWKRRLTDEGWRAEKRDWLAAVEADDAALRA